MGWPRSWGAIAKEGGVAGVVGDASTARYQVYHVRDLWHSHKSVGHWVTILIRHNTGLKFSIQPKKNRKII